MLWSKGNFIAKGTADNPISLIGKRQIKGDWIGIKMSTTKNNYMDYVNIKHAGQYSVVTNYTPSCAIYMWHGVDLQITNSSFSDCEGTCAIYRGTSYGFDNLIESNNNYNGMELCKF